MHSSTTGYAQDKGYRNKLWIVLWSLSSTVIILEKNASILR